MTRYKSVNLRWTVLVSAAAALLATGAGATYFVLRSGDAFRNDSGQPGVSASTTPASSAAAPIARAPSDSSSSLTDVVVALSQEAADRAGIAVARVGTGGAATVLRLPGVVEPNAYRQVTVTPFVAGRVTRVLVELGEAVHEGQTLARVFSPELAEAHTRYTSARADLEAHERELRRTETLVEIGAASRQELERLHAEHTARTSDVRSASSRLELLGVRAAALDAASEADEGRASANVTTPIDGVVTERLANVGLNVDAAAKLFTVVDLSDVWVVADLYEKDFPSVRVGTAATITTNAYPDLALRGRVGYIDPQVSAQTRTAKLRVVVRNPRGELRLGMYADVVVTGTETNEVPIIPRSAVQTVNESQVVYLINPNEPGRFTERQVRLGRAAGEQVEVLSGVRPGDVVVTKGSFFVRAERERLGLRAPASAVAGPEGTSEAGTTRREAGGVR